LQETKFVVYFLKSLLHNILTQLYLHYYFVPKELKPKLSKKIGLYTEIKNFSFLDINTIDNTRFLFVS